MRNDRISDWAVWGRADQAMRLEDRPKLVDFLHQQLGPLAEPQPPVALGDVLIPATRLGESDLAALSDIVGPDNATVDHDERVVHSVGKSYRDMLTARAGRLDRVTDAVVFPDDEAEVASVLALASSRGWTVVPFGGGTSVVGGVEPLSDDERPVVTLDLVRLNHVTLNDESHQADIGAGAFGPDIEARLGAAGFTLGHLPQSFEFSSLGGWVATRGAGQQSTHYGKIEELVQAVRLATPKGVIATRNVPASAAGPDLVQQIVGSEGTLGVITSATVRVRPVSSARQYRAYFVPDFRTGCTLIRNLLQADIEPAVVRLSDAEETRWLLKTSNQPQTLVRSAGKVAIQWLMKRRGFDLDKVCLCLLSFEGSYQQVDCTVREADKIAQRYNALSLGASPGESWERDRYKLPYLRDELMARGIMVDTLETATTWDNLQRLETEVRSAIQAGLGKMADRSAVMVHVSHVYPTGASLYYTFVAPQQAGKELDQWLAVKQAATRAIVTGGGTLSHHHGIGYEHLPLSAEHGELAVEALRTLKTSLDPERIMNPGKLLADR